MKNKKVLISFLSVVFALITIVSVFMMFTVKKVNVNFSVYTDTTETADIQKKIDKYVGKNLIFFNLDEIKNLDIGPCFEITSVSKNYPNVIDVKIKQRKERFVYSFQGENYLLSDEGYVLKKVDDSVLDEFVKIELDNIFTENPVLGNKLKTDFDWIINDAVAFSGVDGVVDATTKITITKKGEYWRAISFKTRTDVVINFESTKDELWFDLEDVSKAFSEYFNAENDYIKSYNMINVSKIEETGELKIAWINN